MPENAELIAEIASCRSCEMMAPRYCLAHTCPDCGNPTNVVHGSPAMPGPCPAPGSFMAAPDPVADLWSAVANRPIHAKFLESLLVWAEEGADDDAEPNPDDVEGLTFDLGVALVLDVRAIFLGEREVYPLAYPAERSRERKKPKKKPETLWDMMEIRGMH